VELLVGMVWVKALEVFPRVHREEHPQRLQAMNSLAMLYMTQGHLAKAEPLLAKALEVGRIVLAEEHPDLLNYLNNLAALYEAQGEFAKAERLFREALAKTRKLSGEGSLQVAVALTQLSLNLLQQKKTAEAEPLLRECLKIRELKEAAAWTTFNTKSLLGGSLLGQKKYAEAEPLVVQGYDGMKQREAKIPAEDKVCLTEALERLVQLYEAQSKPDEAARWRAELAARKASPKETEKPPAKK
jgi:eukaryotic-like serine/threonine-protein kinase